MQGMLWNKNTGQMVSDDSVPVQFNGELWKENIYLLSEAQAMINMKVNKITCRGYVVEPIDSMEDMESIESQLVAEYLEYAWQN